VAETALWWIRRDLRLSDNQALSAALEQSGTVIPVFVWDTARLSSASAPGSRAVAFLVEGLRRLDADLHRRGSRLIFRVGDTAQELAALLGETGAGAIWAEEEWTPAARDHDARLAEALPLRLAGGLTLHPPDAVVKADGRPYSVYGAYRRAWKALPLPGAHAPQPAPARLAPPPDVAARPLPEHPTPHPGSPFVPAESEARQRLQEFLDPGGGAIFQYAALRDRLDLEGTSRLSPYLRWGMISARQALAGALAAREAAPDDAARQGVDSWIDELIWREFYIAILAHFPDAARQSLNPRLRGIEWRQDEDGFEAWREGRTGYPVVDAAMRQLARTGWLPNRARMIAASFLVKDLLIDWRRGEQWFMEQLVDGDPAANNGGWQWVAGTGTDAAPYFRVFNPVAQGRRHDPAGVYVRRWLPELARVPDRYVHAPWEMPPDVVGRDYPAPIEDHARTRERALAAYGRARSQAGPGL
jgi:deoxyribodipyrimidine photo-lyase